MRKINALQFFYLLVLVLFSSCGHSQKPGQSTVDDFKSQISKTKNPQLIDVRTPEEFNDGRIAGSVNINFYDKDFSEKIKSLDKQKPVFVYCAAGGRGATAAGIMKEQGFKEVYNLTGGIDEWKQKGNEVVK